MPSDNLENLFREKVAEVQHTPPPQFTWTPEKSWDQLQPLLPAPRRKIKSGFYLGVAAGLVLALLAGLSLYRFSVTEIPATTVAVSTNQPWAKPTKKALGQPEENGEEPSQLLAATGTAGPTVTPKATATDRKMKADEPLTQTEETYAAQIDQDTKQETAAQPAILAAATPAASSQPLKITVVLGAKTLARAEALALETAAVSETNLLAQEKPKKKKLRLRIHHPDTGLPTDTQLATIKPFRSDIGLGTRIKF